VLTVAHSGPLRASGAALAALAVVASAITVARFEATGSSHPSNETPTRVHVVPTTPTTIEKRYGAIRVLGDSLSAQSWDEESAALAAQGWVPVTIDAVPGRRTNVTEKGIPSGLAGLVRTRETSAGDVPTWVVELGTNDVSELGDDADGYRDVIETMLDAIGPGHRIVWVNVHNGLDPHSSEVFNLVLGAVAAERGDVVIADWAAVADTPGYLVPDGIHLTATGEVAFANVIADAADTAAALPVVPAAG
jgi:lysophospholipase L1-like esterase